MTKCDPWIHLPTWWWKELRAKHLGFPYFDLHAFPSDQSWWSWNTPLIWKDCNAAFRGGPRKRTKSHCLTPILQKPKFWKYQLLKHTDNKKCLVHLGATSLSLVSGCRNFIEAIWGRADSCNGNLWLEKLQCKAIQDKGGSNVREN